jgi:hypothetical protein
MPNHQFGFRQRHSTIEETHPNIQKINKAFDDKQYCSAAFLDISEAFDRVWHIVLLYKLRLYLPLNYCIILKSYFHSRHILVKTEREYTELSPINAGVLQGSVFGPFILPVADLKISPETTTATFPDDTTVLAHDNDPVVASLNCNPQLVKKWRIKANKSKSVHVTFNTQTHTHTQKRALRSI